ncbi:MAG TPA: FlgD immunoglobulin-like domain containing protein [Gaiellaceae bacterium]|nr:FlgD immunoglobulin-like domain containing protein [Gaiellaceae bacterium]
MRTLLLAVLLLAAAPAAARAGVSMTSVDVPLHGARTLAAAAPARFDMLGVHWRGPGAVLYSTRSAAGGWSGWRVADADPAAGWRLGDLAWLGPSTGVRFRTRGTVTRLRAYYVESTVERTPARRLSVAGSPPIVPRAGWGADESIRKGAPQYADALRFAVVHHTAGTNDYTRAESAAIVRGIELYHVQGNGWNDIGYNFLVDKYGQIFEGRYGGVDKPVVGAHAQGFNTGSVGIAVLGEYGSTKIGGAAKAALVKLLAWRLDVAHVDPLSTLTWASGGNPRFPARVPVFLRAVSGHRDTNFTDCPGNALYAQLPEIAREAAASGGPKLYEPQVAGRLGGPIRFTGTLSGEAKWTVAVAGSSGAVVATQDGVGPTLDWTWDSADAPPDRYTWTISGPSLRGASGSLGTKTTTALALQKPTASPQIVSPGGDASGDAATIAYTLTQAATVEATVVGPAGTVTTLWSGVQPAGRQSLVWTPSASQLPGVYEVELSARTDAGATATAAVAVYVDPTLQSLAVAPAALSPALGGTASVSLTLAGPAAVEVDVLRGGEVVATAAETSYPAGVQTVSWDGTLADGTPAPDGRYTVRVTVTDSVTTLTRSAPLSVDSTPPAVTVVSAKAMRFRLSEPATVTLVVGSRRYTSARRAGPIHFWLKTKPYAYKLIAVDAAGNRFVRLYRTR